jgi:hypothetical protein
MRLHRLDLVLDRALEQPGAVPPRHEVELVILEDGPQHGGVAREFAAELHAFIAGLLRLVQTSLERIRLAELRQIVVGPGQRIDADAYHLGS